MGAALHRLLALAWKEVVQLRRDRMSVGLILGMPLIQFLVFAFAINTEVRHQPLAVLDYDHSIESRELPRRLAATGSFDYAGDLRNETEAENALASGRAAAVLVIHPGYGASLRAGERATAQIRIDASDPLSVGSGSAATAGLIEIIALEAGARRALDLNTVTRYNPEQRTALYIVPGLVGVILSTSLVVMTAIAVSRERERGTIEALFASPVRGWEIIVGKLLPGIVVGYAQMALVLGLGDVLFGINPLPVSWQLTFVGGFFIAGNLAIGLLISTAVTTQAQAMQLALLTMLPNILLSGFMFPIAAMPTWAQWFAECLPLTHFLRIDRALLLKGAGLQHVGYDLIALIAILGLLVFFAALRVRTRLA